MQLLFKLYRLVIQILCIPIFLSDYLNRETGKEYGIGTWTKLILLYKMIRNNTKIISGSSFIEHIHMATAIMKLPKSVEGVVVECGSYKGVSAANLSLVCALCHRRFEIFDSFEGLPEPSAQDKSHILLSAGELHTYTKGTWCGTLDEVRANITKYGNINVCNFNKGYFVDTLPHFKKKTVFAWLDVDYRSSLENCVQYLWPLLQDGCSLYTHEATHSEIASLFFSEEWWKNKLNTIPPGLVGAGCGIGFKILSGSYFSSSMGYTIKNPDKINFNEVPQIGGIKINLQSSMRLTSTSALRSPELKISKRDSV